MQVGFWRRLRRVLIPWRLLPAHLIGLAFREVEVHHPMFDIGPSGTRTRSCGPHVLVDEPPEEIPPFDVGHTVGLFDGRETLGYLKLQSSMRASPVVVLHIDRKDAIEMPGAHDQQPVQALRAKRLYPALGEGVRVRRSDRRADHPDPF